MATCVKVGNNFHIPGTTPKMIYRHYKYLKVSYSGEGRGDGGMEGRRESTIKGTHQMTDNVLSLGSGVGFPFPGNYSLESPWLPWNPVYSRISFCVEFSYLLSTNTTSSIQVHIVTRTKYSQLLWSVSGFQGNIWARAGIPVSTTEAYKVSFVPQNNSTSMLHYI